MNFDTDNDLKICDIRQTKTLKKRQMTDTTSGNNWDKKRIRIWGGVAIGTALLGGLLVGTFLIAPMDWNQDRIAKAAAEEEKKKKAQNT